MNLLHTEIEGVVVIEPRGSRTRGGFSWRCFTASVTKHWESMRIFAKTISRFRAKKPCEGCTTSFPANRLSWCRCCKARFSMWRLTSAEGRRPSAVMFGVRLSGRNRRQLFIPQGFAHGFCVLSETALFAYKCSDFYAPDCDRGILWSDPTIGIAWPVEAPLLSAKDQGLPLLKDISPEKLPVY